MVKAIRIHRTGGPEVMVLEDVALEPPGPGMVLSLIHISEPTRPY